MSEMRTDDYAGQATEETLDQLQADLATGLTAGEAQARLQRHGPNEIREREEAGTKRTALPTATRRLDNRS